MSAPRLPSSTSALTFALLLSSTLLAACGSGSSRGEVGGPDDPSDESHTSEAATCSQRQKSYVGFSGTKLEEARLEAPAGSDRIRMKPYGALADDYKRLLETVPSVLEESGPTFGSSGPRWSSEPLPGAVNLYQAYRVAFEGCLEFTKSETKWGVAPTNETASMECAVMARKFWSRTPTSDEVSACADFAVNGAATEQGPGGSGTKETTPRRRWSYACAAILTGSSFLMY